MAKKWSEIQHKSTPEQRTKAREELDAEIEARRAEKIPISFGLLLDIVETLRLAHVAALKDSPNAHLLVEDFKPHKWTDYEVEFAEKASEQCRLLLDEMQEARGT